MDLSPGVDPKIVDALWRDETDLMNRDLRQTFAEIEEAGNTDRRIEDASNAALLRLLKRDPEFVREFESWSKEPHDPRSEPLEIRRPVREVPAPEPGLRTRDYVYKEGTTVTYTPPYLRNFAVTAG